MTVSSTACFSNLKEDIKDHFKTDLGDFYISSAHRWLIYAITFILVGLGTFISLEIYEQTDPLLNITLMFKGMHAWHSAINFTVCLATVDHLVAWLLRPWGAFDRRSVGKVWMVFILTYLVGFVSQRTLVYRLVALYSPELLWVHEMDPLMRPGILPMFLFMLPFWGIIVYSVLRIMLSKQTQAQELFRVRIDTILEERQRQTRAELPYVSKGDGAPKADVNAFVPLPPESGVGPILIKQVCHVTVEDHYLRIHYQGDHALKSTLIRMPLKELSASLPKHQFIHIHRSHIVNLEQVAGLKRAGRDVRLSTKHGRFELPVSRHRFPQILPVLEKYLHPN